MAGSLPGTSRTALAPTGIKDPEWSLFFIDQERTRTQVAPAWTLENLDKPWHEVRADVSPATGTVEVQVADGVTAKRFTIPSRDRSSKWPGGTSGRRMLSGSEAAEGTMTTSRSTRWTAGRERAHVNVSDQALLPPTGPASTALTHPHSAQMRPNADILLVPSSSRGETPWAISNPNTATW